MSNRFKIVRTLVEAMIDGSIPTDRQIVEEFNRLCRERASWAGQ